MTVEVLSTAQAQSRTSKNRKPEEAAGRFDPAETRFTDHSICEDWQMRPVQPPQFIPRVFPGL